MTDFDEVAIPEDIKVDALVEIAAQFDVLLEEHEGFFNPDEIRFLVYGESGSGKTVFSSTWPDCVFLDIDKGMSSVTRRVGRIPIGATPQSTAWEVFLRALSFIESGQHNFKTIVVDSLNEMQSISMDHIKEKYPEVRRPYNRLASQSDYGMMLFDFEYTIRRMKALPMNVVFIAQVAPQQYETDVVQPQLVGKHTPRNVARMMDIIGYLYKQEGGEDDTSSERKTRIMVFDAVNHVTKDRSDVLPMTVENPSYSELYAYWQTQFETE